MKLTVIDRLNLLDILEQTPYRNGVAYLRVRRDLIQDISFPESEIKEIDLRVNEAKTGYTWDQRKAKNKEVEIGEIGKEIIADCLKFLDENKAMLPQHLMLWDRFVGVDNGPGDDK